MLHVSASRKSFFRNGYSRLSAAAASERRLHVFFVSLMFLLPSIYVYTAGSPALLPWSMQRFRWVEVPPQADPSILKKSQKHPHTDAAS